MIITNTTIAYICNDLQNEKDYKIDGNNCYYKDELIGDIKEELKNNVLNIYFRPIKSLQYINLNLPNNDINLSSYTDIPFEETPKEAAERLFLDCYPNWYDNGKFMKKVIAKEYCKKIVNAIIKETLDEYTNDENHVRVIFWKQVLIEIDAL